MSALQDIVVEGVIYGDVSYTKNTISNIFINGSGAIKSQSGATSHMDNVILNDRYDTDGDGLGDGYEWFESGTAPLLYDTDGDDLNDGFEVLTLMTNATLEDTDGEGLGDGYELFDSGTDPLSNDTDSDGLNDGFEVLTLMTNATLKDTDDDGLGDGYELFDSAQILYQMIQIVMV